jgi:hypothetical protein
MHRLHCPRPLFLLAACYLPLLTFAQEADFPDVAVSADSRDWFAEPIIWISAGAIFLLLFWIARRRRTRPE